MTRWFNNGLKTDYESMAAAKSLCTLYINYMLLVSCRWSNIVSLETNRAFKVQISTCCQ